MGDRAGSVTEEISVIGEWVGSVTEEISVIGDWAGSITDEIRVISYHVPTRKKKQNKKTKLINQSFVALNHLIKEI